jgi:integrase
MARIKPAERARDRVLSIDELRALWPKAGPFVRFLLLTAVRRSEAAGMRWDELDGSLWIIPAARMKGKAEHIVPLSAAALSCIGLGPILSERQGPAIDRVPMAADGRAAFVFGGSRPLGGLSHLKRRLDDRIGRCMTFGARRDR